MSYGRILHVSGLGRDETLRIFASSTSSTHPLGPGEVALGSSAKGIAHGAPRPAVEAAPGSQASAPGPPAGAEPARVQTAGKRRPSPAGWPSRGQGGRTALRGLRRRPRVLPSARWQRLDMVAVRPRTWWTGRMHPEELSPHSSASTARYASFGVGPAGVERTSATPTIQARIGVASKDLHPDRTLAKPRQLQWQAGAIFTAESGRTGDRAEPERQRLGAIPNQRAHQKPAAGRRGRCAGA